MIALSLFVSTFVLVFALGFQSQNVTFGHYRSAFFTSFAISISNLVLYKLAPDATMIEAAAFISGGPFGIVTAMWAHRRLFPKSRSSRFDEYRAQTQPATEIGSTPTSYWAGMLWHDHATGRDFVRDQANAKWIDVTSIGVNVNCGDDRP